MANIFGDFGALIGGASGLYTTQQGYDQALKTLYGTQYEAPSTYETPEGGWAQEAQRGALQNLATTAQLGGRDRAFQGQVRAGIGAAQTAERGARQAALQQMARQNTLGGGQQLASLQAGNQAAGQMAAASGQQAAQAGGQRALQAMTAGGQLATGARGQAQAYQQAQQQARQFNALQRAQRARELSGMQVGRGKTLGDLETGLGTAAGEFGGDLFSLFI